ncbi:MAG: UvrD-helicase domain-containing protein [Gemmatimonadetes bacterium]|nr:UvrD-helicase domain-containing protein [Gemmatimonadota bacterium]
MELTRDLLSELNEPQRLAVEHFEGPLLVLAGAGSGKTRVLTHRIAHLIAERGVAPGAILAVTFTNRAADEMRGRLHSLLGGEPAGLWMGTFHAFGARILRRFATRLGWSPRFTILDAEDAQRQVKRIMEELKLPKRWKAEAVHSAISSAKNQLVGSREYAETALDPFSRAAADIYPRYERALRESNGFDFDDLLMKPVELFREHEEVLAHFRQRFHFLLVDEYQDTNHAQYRLLALLAQAHRNLCVVGDDDQSIYGWRGADIRNILEFEKDFPNARVICLEQNYRSTGTILRVANRVIAENVHRKGKRLFTENPEGNPVTVVRTGDEVDEATWVVDDFRRRLTEPGRTYRDVAVLYRTNAQSRALEEALRRAALPYRIYGGVRFYERREIRDVLAYLRLMANPGDAASFLRIVNTPRRGIGDVTLTALSTWAAGQGTSLLEAARRAREIPELAPSAARALVDFALLVDRYRGLAAQLPVHELLGGLVSELQLFDVLRGEGPEGVERVENVKELLASAAEFESDLVLDEEEREILKEATPLDLFLQHVSLITDVDRMDPEADAVTLLTLHNAKGLEFPVVYISGLEEGLLPLSRAYDSPAELEEERRLFYVGITRAQQALVLTYARSRRRGGDVLPCVASSFLQPLLEGEGEGEGAGEVVEVETPRSAERHPWRWRGWEEEDVPWRRSRDRRGGSDVVEETAPDLPDVPRLVKGERVRHPLFGAGTVAELDGAGANLKAVIDFDSVGRKKVMVRHANLERAWE